MKKLAIFDFDGTLFNSIDDVVICLNKALSIHGFPTLTHDEYVKRLGGNIDEIVSLVLKDQSTPQNIELVRNTYDDVYSSLSKANTLPFANVGEVLETLQDKGVLLTINSNRTSDSINHFIGRYFAGIDFEVVEGHNPDYPSKPDPFGVKRILEKLNVSKDDSIYIGDSSTDIKTAKNAEIDCLIVEWGYGFQEDYENDYPLAIIDEPSQILKYF